MGSYKICVYAICKNEEKFVDRWMDSMSEADLVVVTDTGSEDLTVEKLKQRGAEVYIEKIEPWRFDTARNISLSHVPEDTDVCVCTDLDEVFEPNWREKIETAWDNNKDVAKTGRYLYNWSFKENGEPDVQFNYFKIHERHNFRWVCPVHEYVSYEGKLPLVKIYIDGLVLNHYADSSKPRSSYLPLLEMAVKEMPNDARMWYYLGREYTYKSMWEKCIQTLNHFLMLPEAWWDEERCAAMRLIAKSHLNLGQYKAAYSWYYKAIAEAPHMREPYVEFAKMCYQLEDWVMTYFLSENALKIGKKSPTYVNMGYAWDYTPHDLCAIAAYELNMIEKSLYHAKLALNHAPQNERLKKNMEIIQKLHQSKS